MSRRALPWILAVLVLPACHDGGEDDDAAAASTAGNTGSTGGSGSSRSGPISLAAPLSGNQESPPVSSFGSGDATFFISADRQRVQFTLTTSNLSGITMAHVHIGPIGIDGPIIFDLSAGPFVSPLAGELRTDALRPQPGAATFEQAVDAIARGAAYVNVHTTAFPDGEIRGQIGPATFTAALDGTRVVPPALTLGTGTATLALDEGQARLDFTLDVVNLSGLPTQARIHAAPLGVNGPAIFNLSTTMFDRSLSGSLSAADVIPAPSAGIITFADAVDAILSRNAYVVVTSAALPGGEIRGQYVPGALPVPIPPAPVTPTPIAPTPITPTPITPTPITPTPIAPTPPSMIPTTPPNSNFVPPMSPASNFTPPSTTPFFTPLPASSLPAATIPAVSNFAPASSTPFITPTPATP